MFSHLSGIADILFIDTNSTVAASKVAALLEQLQDRARTRLGSADSHGHTIPGAIKGTPLSLVAQSSRKKSCCLN